MKKQKMIRWLAWAVAGIACVAGGIHVNQKYQEKRQSVRLKPVLRQKARRKKTLQMEF